MDVYRGMIVHGFIKTNFNQIWHYILLWHTGRTLHIQGLSHVTRGLLVNIIITGYVFLGKRRDWFNDTKYRYFDDFHEYMYGECIIRVVPLYRDFDQWET